MNQTIADRPPEFLTKLEVAGLLRKTPRTIETWMHLGYLRHFKIGKAVLFQRSAVLDSLKRFEVGGADEP